MASIYDTITVDLNGATPQQKQRLLAAIVGNHGRDRREGETDQQLANRFILDYLVAEIKGWERHQKEAEIRAAYESVDQEFPKE